MRAFATSASGSHGLRAPTPPFRVADHSTLADDAGPDRLKAHAEVTQRRRATRAATDVTFRWVIETVDGVEGREVELAQARAIEELARWLCEPNTTEAKGA